MEIHEEGKIAEGRWTSSENQSRRHLGNGELIAYRGKGFRTAWHQMFPQQNKEGGGQ